MSATDPPSHDIGPPNALAAHQEHGMNLQELKAKKPAELLAYAENLEIENASTLRKQDMMFAILKQLAENERRDLSATACSRCCRTASASCARPEANYLPGPDDIYVSPEPDPPLRPAHRRHGRGRDPRAEGRRALLRAAQGQRDQLRGCRQRSGTGSTSTT